MVEIRGGFDILSSNAFLFSSFTQPSQMSTRWIYQDVKRVTSTRFISMLLTIYLVQLWLPNVNESLARLEGP